jgi:uncharacterized protein YhbP (UPF0306 family)
MEESNDEKARRIIADNIYLTLATCDLKNKPWAAPVYYAYDSDYNFYFVSAKDSLHATHIAENPAVGIAIYNSTIPAGECDGVQIDGMAHVAGVTDLPKALGVYSNRRFRDPKERSLHINSVTDFWGVALLRIFVVRVVKAYTLDPTVKEVDKRIEARLKPD